MKIKPKSWNIAGVVLLALLPPAVCLSQPTAQVETRQLSATNAKYSVILTDVNPGPKSLETELVYNVRDELSGKTREIRHVDSLVRVKGIFLASDKKLVTTGTMRKGYIVTIIDLETEEGDALRCFKHSFSPSKRWVAYESWYPTGVPPKQRCSLLLVYDLAKTPSENRLPSYAQLPELAFPGLPVYPEVNAVERTYDRMIDGTHLFRSPFLWSDDEKTLVFTEFDQADGRNYLVRIDLSRGIDLPPISRDLIDLRDYVKWDNIHQSDVEKLEARPYAIQAKEIRWTGAGQVTIRPRHEYWLHETITLTLPSSE